MVTTASFPKGSGDQWRLPLPFTGRQCWVPVLGASAGCTAAAGAPVVGSRGGGAVRDEGVRSEERALTVDRVDEEGLEQIGCWLTSGTRPPPCPTSPCARCRRRARRGDDGCRGGGWELPPAASLARVPRRSPLPSHPTALVTLQEALASSGVLEACASVASTRR